MGNRVFFALSASLACWVATATTSLAAPPNLIEVWQGGIKLGVVQPYTGALTGAANYNYTQFDGDPINGPSPQAFQGRLFFYQGSDGLHFNVIFNESGLGNGVIDWNLTILNSSTNPFVQVTDDPVPISSVADLRETGNNFYEGHWAYSARTDGGVIGPLGGEQWSLTINQLGYTTNGNNLGIRNLYAYGGDGTILSLLRNTTESGQIVFRTAAIPEPKSLLLLLSLGAVGLGWIKARRV